MAVTIDDVRPFALSLPRRTRRWSATGSSSGSGGIVFVAFSRDETLMGFGFPKEEREALVASEPDKFQMPKRSDMRYNWVVARLDALDLDEMRELVLDAWRMCVPKSVAAQYDAENCGLIAPRSVPPVCRPCRGGGTTCGTPTR